MRSTAAYGNEPNMYVVQTSQNSNRSTLKYVFHPAPNLP